MSVAKKYERISEAARAAKVVERTIFEQYGESWIIDFDRGFRFHVIDMGNPRDPIDWGWWHSFGAAVQKILMQLPELNLDTSIDKRPSVRYTVG